MVRSLTFWGIPILILWLFPTGAGAQTVFSRFDFNDVPITIASIGPAGVSHDPDATSNGSSAVVTANCGPNKGLNLVTNNNGGLYDQGSLGMTFRFKRLETYASFFLRGGTEFYVQGGQLRVNYRTYNAQGGFTNNNPLNLLYTLPADNNFHTYTFEYYAPTGTAGIKVDGVIIWSADGPDNMPLYWVGDPAPVIGIIMDGNCTGPGFLDYALFYVPPVPLAVEFVSFAAQPQGDDVLLSWTAARASAQNDFVIERRTELGFYEVIGRVPSMAFSGIHKFEFVDQRPGEGLWFYHVRQVDDEGVETISPTRTALLTAGSTLDMRVWPNPADSEVNIQVGNYVEGGILTLENQSGVVVAQVDLVEGQARIPLTTLPAALYFVHYRAQGQHLVSKLLVR